jgi:hypothetical protein
LRDCLFQNKRSVFTLADALKERICALFDMSQAIEKLYLLVADCSQVLDEFLELLSGRHRKISSRLLSYMEGSSVYRDVKV